MGGKIKIEQTPQLELVSADLLGSKTLFLWASGTQITLCS